MDRGRTVILDAPAEVPLSRSEILRRPGWRPCQIWTLGEPDRLVINDRNWRRPVRLWRLSWVERVERNGPGS